MIENLEKVKSFFERFNIKVKVEDIDGIAIKKMAATNVIKENRTSKKSSKQTHIAITGELRKFFPIVTTINYLKDGGIKGYSYKIPIILLKENLEYLNFEEKDKDIETYTICYIGHGGSEQDIQIQLSKKTKDEENFIKFRSKIYEDDYLVIIKIKENFKYYFLNLKKEEKSNIISIFGKDEICYFDSNPKEVIFEDTYLINDKEIKSEKFPYQKIVYGAPGTGKSYSLNEEVESIFGVNKERVTFYDGYTYGQFIGMYKPVTIINREKLKNQLAEGREEKDIGYKYIPGPFMKQLVKAYKDSSNKFCLIIEEINRAKADKVFGNIFQLLDRDDKGNSRYPISVSEEQIQYLTEELTNEKDILERIEKEGLYLPKNLYIWATMNSADDGVQPLDTAFKRRWKFNYISLNANEGNFGNGETFIIGQYKDKDILWNNFRTALNDTLKVNTTEDRLIAPFFISPNDFEEIDTSIKKIDKNILSEKVLMYIFDDLLRHYPKLRKEIFHNDIKTFSDIHEKVTENDNFLGLIFNEGFLNQILGSDGTDGKE